MKKLLIIQILIVCCFILLPQNCYAQNVSPQHYDGFKMAIIYHGYVYESVSYGSVMGQGTSGIKFRILCNDDLLAYFVTTAPNTSSGFCVEPWAKKGQKCNE